MKKLQIATAIVFSTLSASAQAQYVELEVTDYDYDSIPDVAEDAYTAELDAFVDDVETQINNSLDSFPTDTNAFMDGTADAMVAANAGNSFTYNTDFSLFMAGFNLGATFDKGSASLSKLLKGTSAERRQEVQKVRGAGAGGGLIGAIPLSLFTDGTIGFIELNRVKLFGSFMFLDLPAFGPFNSKVVSIGAGAQYRLIQGASVLGGLAGWGGIDVSSGIKFAKVDLSIGKDIAPGEVEITQEVQGQEMTIGVDGTASFGLTSTNFIIPIEVSTSAKLVYILDFFVGLGTDIAFGSTKSDSEAPGNISIDGGPSDPKIGAEFNLGDGSGKPKFLNARYFAGLGLDLYVADLSIQFTQGLGGEPMGVNAGLRAYW